MNYISSDEFKNEERKLVIVDNLKNELLKQLISSVYRKLDKSLDGELGTRLSSQLDDYLDILNLDKEVHDEYSN
jgi:hypothetical protein